MLPIVRGCAFKLQLSLSEFSAAMSTIPITVALLVPMLLAAAAPGRAAGNTTPDAVVTAFYQARIASGTRGAPSADELALLAPYLGPELHCLLAAAARFRDRHSAHAPDDKPPFAEGDLYSSVFEGPTRFVLERHELAATRAVIQVRFFYDDRGVADRVGWVDTIHLARHADRWLIEDIEYQLGCDFCSRGRLADNLRSELAPTLDSPRWAGMADTGCVSP